MTSGRRGTESLPAAEWGRKAVHAGMGLFALALRWLDWKAAALCALAALLFNVFAMPRIGRGIYRDPARPRDPGIVAYPAMVLLLILLFRYELPLAAALWGMLAFGDPAATIAGKSLGGPRLPWNAAKSWSGSAAYVLVGGLAAAALGTWVALGRSPEPHIAARLAGALLPVVLLGAFLESLPTGLDDNWIPGLPCALLLAYEWVLMPAPGSRTDLPAPMVATALLVNGGIAALTGLLGIVRPSGAIAGGLVGTVILALCGWSAYGVLWAFFLFGTLATRLGRRRKAAIGTAQADEGRRGARHVLANCGVGTVVCVMGYLALEGHEGLFGAAFVASFAAAFADTLGTEIGSLYGRRTVSLATARVVPAGSPGGVSLPGLLAGLAGAALLGTLGCLMGLLPWRLLWVVAAAGFLGSVLESVLLDAARRRGAAVDHEFANTFNTFAGAVLAWMLTGWIRQGFVAAPFDWRGI